MILETKGGENSRRNILANSDILWKAESSETFHFDFRGSLAALVRTISLAQRGWFFLNLWSSRDSRLPILEEGPCFIYV